MRWLNGITDSTDMNLGKQQKTVSIKEAWCAAVHGVVNGRTRLGDWKTTPEYPWSLPSILKNDCLSLVTWQFIVTPVAIELKWEENFLKIDFNGQKHSTLLFEVYITDIGLFH